MNTDSTKAICEVPEKTHKVNFLKNEVLNLDWIKVRRWTGKGLFAILDQGIFAGTNFIVNILLARWLTPEGYGAFTVAYSIFWLAMGLHSAILIEPMMVFGAGRHSKNFKKYLGALSYGHLLISGGLLVLLLLGGLGLRLSGEQQVSMALIGVGFAAPFILLLWLFRRTFFVELRPHLAAAGVLLYMVVFLAAIFFLKSLAALTPARVFLCMGAASAAASLGLLTILKPEFGIKGDGYYPTVARDHWGYGKWSLGTTALMWIPGNIYFMVLPLWVGLHGAAALRALLNPLMPFLHSIGALGGLFLPLLSGRIAEGKNEEANSLVKLTLALFLAGALMFWLVLAFWGREIMRLLYGGRYLEVSYLLKIAGILIFSASCVAVMGSALRASERPDKVFWGYVVAFGVTVAVGLPVAKIWGISGATIGLVSASVANAFTLSFFWLRRQKVY